MVRAFSRCAHDLRQSCSDIWVIDARPRGTSPPSTPASSKGFSRKSASFWRCAAPMQRSENWRASATARFPKATARTSSWRWRDLTLTDTGWQDGETSLRGPFLPERGLGWGAYPALLDLFDWSTPGVKTHRTWVIAPDAASLHRRWETLNARDGS